MGGGNAWLQDPRTPGLAPGNQGCLSPITFLPGLQWPRSSGQTLGRVKPLSEEEAPRPEAEQPQGTDPPWPGGGEVTTSTKFKRGTWHPRHPPSSPVTCDLTSLRRCSRVLLTSHRVLGAVSVTRRVCLLSEPLTFGGLVPREERRMRVPPWTEGPSPGSTGGPGTSSHGSASPAARNPQN